MQGVVAGWQEEDGRSGPSPDLSSSIKKTLWVGWTVNSTEWGTIKKWLPVSHQGWRACIAPAVFRSPAAW